jgi:hypothetical protein
MLTSAFVPICAPARKRNNCLECGIIIYNRLPSALYCIDCSRNIHKKYHQRISERKRIEREKRMLKCFRCNHIWAYRVKNPKVCPRCSSFLWQKKKIKRGKNNGKKRNNNRRKRVCVKDTNK